MKLRILLLMLLAASQLQAQDRKIDPTWLHRYVPQLNEGKADLASETCHYVPIFGDGDTESRIMRSVARFGEVRIDAHGSCRSVLYDREEEIYFVQQGSGTLQYGDESHPVRANDFTYLPPGVKHSLISSSDQTLRVLVMSFKIPTRTVIGTPPPHVRVINLDDVKEETVQGHPASVLYKLMVGPHTGKRDAIDEAYVVTSLFLMNFAPGGTNFPHHHETAEEIYVVIDGQGDMVAGGGTDGIEGRHPAKAGDAYYFRPNCTVGFYNQDKPGIHAYILAVRSRMPLPEDDD